MRIDRRLLGWGVFFILVGAIPLAVQQGWIPDDIAWWQLWPFILIGLGIGLLLRRTSVAPLGGLVVAATLGLMVGGLLANGTGSFPVFNVGCAGGGGGTTFPQQVGTFSESSADVRLDLGCGDLSVATRADAAGWIVAGTSDGGRVPRIASAAGSLTVTEAEGSNAFFRPRSTWDVTLPTTPRIDLEATVNAGKGQLDLGGATIGEVSLTLNAGDATIDLSKSTIDHLNVTVNAGSGSIQLPDGSMTGSLTVNAGSVKMCAPTDVALQLTRNDSITSSDNYAAAGLEEVSAHVWQSPDWGSATKRIELSTTANAGGFTLDPEGGCQ
jgi:hypothetical protein